MQHTGTDDKPVCRTTLRTKAELLRVLLVLVDEPNEQQYLAREDANLDSWSNRAHFALTSAGLRCLASNCSRSSSSTALLIFAEDAERAVREVPERAGAHLAVSVNAFTAEQGLSHWGDRKSGLIDIWRAGDDILLVEGSQALG